MIIIINGAPGSGKSKTAEYLFLNTENSAWIDGDVMLTVHPQHRTENELDLRERNIAAVAENYYNFGYKTIYISFVYMGSIYLAKQIALLEKIDKVKVFSLVPSEESLRNRHTNDTYKREGIESSIEINKKISKLEVNEIIDNSDMTIEEVGNYILERSNKV